MDEQPHTTESQGEIFMLVKTDGGTRQPYTPFSGTCGCGCDGEPESCYCAN